MCKKYCNVEAVHRFVPVRIDDEPTASHPCSRLCAPSEFVVRRYVMVVLIVPIAANTIAAQQKAPQAPQKVAIPQNAKGVTEWATKSGKVSANTFIYQEDGSYTKEAWIVVLVAIVIIAVLGRRANVKMLEQKASETPKEKHSYNSDPDPRLWTPKLCEASAVELVIPQKVTSKEDKKTNSFTPQQPIEGGLLVPKKVK